jgi:hypothetical protein
LPTHFPPRISLPSYIERRNSTRQLLLSQKKKILLYRLHGPASVDLKMVMQDAGVQTSPVPPRVSEPGGDNAPLPATTTSTTTNASTTATTAVLTAVPEPPLALRVRSPLYLVLN